MFKILFNTILGIVLIFVWSRFVDLQQIFATLSKVNLVYLGPVALFMLASPIIRAIRLRIFLAEIKRIKLLDLIFLNGAAMMLNFFIPIVLILALLLTYLMVFRTQFAKKLLNFLKHLLIVNSIKIYFDKFSNFILESFAILNRHPKDLGLMFFVTVLAYAADAGIWYFTFLALGVNQDFLKMYLGQALSALTYLIPAAPGYVGSAEASGLLILSGVFGIAPNLASAMTVLFHIASAVFVLIFGLISLYSLKIDLRLVWQKLRRKK